MLNKENLQKMIEMLLCSSCYLFNIHLVKIILPYTQRKT